LGLIREFGLQILLVVRNCNWKKLYDAKGQPYYKNVDTAAITRDAPDKVMQVEESPNLFTMVYGSDIVYFGLKARDTSKRADELCS
jgi:hypothetical protein